MTYRNSLLSLCPPTTPKTTQDADLAAQFDEELPATAPVFEGYLYLRNDSKQWQWRLFRFDGTSFTCLSTRKVKLPPNTRVDAPTNDPPFIHSMPSFTTTSLTSPLLATPKNKSRQQSITSDSLPFAKYYQLPKWTVDIVNISAVSVLKPSNNGSKKKLGMVTSQKSARCFCVRTFDGDCYIMKAQKQKDLERWLFVLTKMWKFAQAMKHQLLSQQPQHQQIIRQQQILGDGNNNNINNNNNNNNNNIQPFYPQLASQQYYQSQDSIPLSQMYQRPRHAPLLSVDINNNSLPMVTSPTTTGAAPIDDRSPYTQNPLSGYEKRYQHPSLSVEKLECIDAWRQSLGELMASDPQLSISKPPPIESIPDDDQVSVISDMTSISHRKPPTLRRRTSVSSSTSKRSNNKVKLRDHHPTPTPSVLKKKRSNDVKNWIEPRKTDKSTSVSPPPPPPPTKSKTTTSLPLIDTFHVSYFQDCKTTARSTTSVDSSNSHPLNNNSQMKDDPGNWISRTKEPTSTVMLDRHAKYHSSTRAKQIQIIDGHPLPTQQFDTTTIPLKTSPSSSIRRQSYSPQQKQPSPSPARRSLDNAVSNSVKYPPHTLMMTESPLYSLAHVETGNKTQDEEEISLADLQRSLKRASLQQNTGLSTSSPTVKPGHHPRHSYQPQQQQQQQQYYNYNHNHPVTAPAIPPFAIMNNTNALMSRTSLLSTSQQQQQQQASMYRKEELSENKTWKRSTSWIPSCEQQPKVMQRRSIHLDTAHW